MALERFNPDEFRELANAPFDSAATRDRVRAALLYAASVIGAADALLRESQRNCTAGVAPTQERRA